MDLRGCRQWGEGFAVSLTLSNLLCTRAIFKLKDLTLRLEGVSPSLDRSLEILFDLDFGEKSFIPCRTPFCLFFIRFLFIFYSLYHSHASSEGNEGNLAEKYSG